MSKNYKVLIDDNYHSMDHSKPLEAGIFGSLDEAIEKCKEITIKSLEHMYEEGISADKLSAQWSMFGDDPYIFGGTGSVPFSARKFITPELCQSIIDSRESGKEIVHTPDPEPERPAKRGLFSIFRRRKD